MKTYISRVKNWFGALHSALGCFYLCGSAMLLLIFVSKCGVDAQIVALRAQLVP